MQHIVHLALQVVIEPTMLYKKHVYVQLVTLLTLKIQLDHAKDVVTHVLSAAGVRVAVYHAHLIATEY